MKDPRHNEAASQFPYEVLTTTELAERLKVKESWVVDQSKPSRTADPIPVFRLGKHRRYLWGSPQLNAWLGRRSGIATKALRDPAKAKKAAEELGTELAQRGARLLVYGGPFLETDVVRGFVGGKPANDRSILMWYT